METYARGGRRTAAFVHEARENCTQKKYPLVNKRGRRREDGEGRGRRTRKRIYRVHLVGPRSWLMQLVAPCSWLVQPILHIVRRIQLQSTNPLVRAAFRRYRQMCCPRLAGGGPYRLIGPLWGHYIVPRLPQDHIPQDRIFDAPNSGLRLPEAGRHRIVSPARSARLRPTSQMAPVSQKLADDCRRSGARHGEGRPRGCRCRRGN